MSPVPPRFTGIAGGPPMTAAAAEGRLSGRDLAAALAIVFIWGMNFVAMKYALRDFTPFQLGAARYVFAALPLVLLIRPPRLHWKWVVLYGLFQGVGQFGFLFSALKVGMTGALASVLMQTQVFFTAIFSYLLLHERATRPLQWGLVLAALGLACFSADYLSPQGSGSATTAVGLRRSTCARPRCGRPRTSWRARRSGPAPATTRCRSWSGPAWCRCCRSSR